MAGADYRGAAGIGMGAVGEGRCWVVDIGGRSSMGRFGGSTIVTVIPILSKSISLKQEMLLGKERKSVTVSVPLKKNSPKKIETLLDVGDEIMSIL